MSDEEGVFYSPHKCDGVFLKHRAWVFPSLEACDAAISAYRSSSKDHAAERAAHVMRAHGGEVYDIENPPKKGFLFQITELT